jgi:hypothetical protein
MDLKTQIGIQIGSYIFIIFLLAFILGKYLPQSQGISIKEIVIYLISLIIVSMVVSPVLISKSSKDKCGRVNTKATILRGLIMAGVTSATFLMVYFINFFSDPFYAIFGTKWWSMGLCYSFFISMSVLLTTTVNYFGGLSDNCKPSMKDIKSNVKNFEKYLQTLDTSTSTTDASGSIPITETISGSVQAPQGAQNIAS